MTAQVSRTEEESTAAPPKPRRTRRLWIALVVVVVLIGAGGAWYVTHRNGRPTDQQASNLPPATNTVSRQDLAETQQEDGTLGYGESTQLLAGHQGTITWLPAQGAVIPRGHTVYRIDNQPTVLFYGSLPFYRVLKSGVPDGPDVAELEQNLNALGYKGFSIDDHFTDATADAVRAWQADLGLDQTGTLAPGQVAIATTAVRVADQTAAVGDTAAPSKPVLSCTGTTHTVSVSMDVADQQLAKVGAKVTVQLPQGTTTNGTVTTIGTVAQAPSSASSPSPGGAASSGGNDATIAVTVTLDDQHAAGSLDQAPVEVNFTSSEHKGVLTVPIDALLALTEGGYGVQLVDGTTSRIVAVHTGLFSDTRVEVSGPGITAGTKVGVPKS